MTVLLHDTRQAPSCAGSEASRYSARPVTTPLMLVKTNLPIGQCPYRLLVAGFGADCYVGSSRQT